MIQWDINRKMFAILIHIYYPDSWKKIILEKLLPLRPYNPLLLVNLCNENSHVHSLVQDIRTDFPEAVVIVTPNKGKDIGGKLALISMFLRLSLEAQYMVMLHDKLSPQAIYGENWRTALFNIIEPESVKAILNNFKENAGTGIVGSSAFLMNEYDPRTGGFASTNNGKIKELLVRYGVKPNNYSFIGGTMFWIRTVIIKSFFSRVSPLSCREILEDGNIMDHAEGSYTHTWERLFCWMASAQGYTIKCI